MRFQVGEFELDDELFELRHRGEAQRVEPQVFDLLAYLLAHRHRVVTKEELLDNVWGDRFVSESALTTRIKQARRAIGDDGNRQTVIRTVHGRGFRIVADVTVAELPDRPTPDLVRTQPRQLGRSLRHPTSTFVGREEDLRHLREQLAAARIVTICGPGGVGKTRLALELASRTAADYDHPPRILELGELEPGSDVPEVVAAEMGVADRSGISVVERLLEALAGRRMLIIADNCEHVLDSTRVLLTALVESGPGIDVIATSRSPLGVPGEQLWPLDPLPTSSPDGSLPPATRLFLDRATAQLPTLDPALHEETVRALVERLDGIPLCLELAASRIRHMGLEGIATALDDPATLARTVGPRDRHASVEHVLAWTYDRLPQRQQRLFARLSVFAGGFDATAVEWVASDDDADRPTGSFDDLSALVDHSLVRSSPASASARYSILSPLREFGRRRLKATGDSERVHRLHAEWVLSTAHHADALLRGPRAADGMSRLELLVPDVRLARRFLVEVDDMTGLAALTRAIFWFAQERGHTEVLSWARDTLDVRSTAGSEAEGVLLSSSAVSAWQRGDVAEARELAEAAVRASTDRGDLCRALLALAAVCQLEGDHAAATRLGAELSVSAEAAADPLFDVLAHFVQAVSSAQIGKPESARRHANIAADIAESCGSPLALAWARYAQGEVLLETDPVEALQRLEQAVGLSRRVGAHLLTGVSGLSRVSLHARHGDSESLSAFGEVIEHWRAAGTVVHQWSTIRNLVEVLSRRGADEAAAWLYGAVNSPERVAPHGAEAERLARAIFEVEARLGSRVFESIVADGARASDLDTINAALAVISDLETEQSRA